jgi:hypothetical protein
MAVQASEEDEKREVELQRLEVAVTRVGMPYLPEFPSCYRFSIEVGEHQNYICLSLQDTSPFFPFKRYRRSSTFCLT